MRIKRHWIVVLAIAGVGLAAWLSVLVWVGPGHNSRAWRSGEMGAITLATVVAFIVARRMIRADALHLRRMMWERDGRCGGCGFALGPGLTTCPACSQPVTPHPPGGPPREPCAVCGYPLTGIRGDRCPECGTLVPTPKC